MPGQCRGTPAAMPDRCRIDAPKTKTKTKTKTKKKKERESTLLAQHPALVRHPFRLSFQAKRNLRGANPSDQSWQPEPLPSSSAITTWPTAQR